MRTGTLSSAWTPDTWYTRNPQTCPSQTLQVSSLEQQPHPPGPFQEGCPHRMSGSGVAHRLGSSLGADRAALWLLSHGDFCCDKDDPIVQAWLPVSAQRNTLPLAPLSSLWGFTEASTHLWPQWDMLGAHSDRAPRALAMGPAAAKEATAQKECCHLWHQPSCTGARVTWQESFHGGMAVPSASSPARSHQPPPSPLISCFSNNPSPLILTSHLVYTSLNQQQNLQAAPAITALVTILHSVWAPLGGKLQETGCLLQEISTSHISHGEGLTLLGLLVLLPEYH